MATYQSSLIEALRNRPQEEMPMSSVMLLPNPTTPSAPVAPRSLPARRGIFNPSRLTMAPAVIPKKAPANQIRPEEFLQMMPDVVGSGIGADVGGMNGGGYGVGQGVNTNLADFGLALMAYGEAGKGLAPGSLAAGVLGSAIAGQQADAMGRAADALSAIESADTPGVVSVSDMYGNVFGMSSPATIAAADAAMFGGGDAFGGYGSGDGWGGGTEGAGLGW